MGQGVDALISFGFGDLAVGSLGNFDATTRPRTTRPQDHKNRKGRAWTTKELEGRKELNPEKAGGTANAMIGATANPAKWTQVF
jgi:hypothetical protein